MQLKQDIHSHVTLCFSVSLCPQEYWVRYVEESSARFLNVPGVMQSQAVTELSSGSSLCSFRYIILPLRPRFLKNILSSQMAMIGLKFMTTHKRLHLREARGQRLYQARLRLTSAVLTA